jgi:hypothetical protein
MQSVEQVGSVTPSAIFVVILLRWLLDDPLRLRSASVHSWDVSSQLVVKVLLLWLLLLLVVTLIVVLAVSWLVTLHHHSLGFFFSVEDHQLFREVLVLHSQLFSDLDETSEAVNVIGALSVDILVHFESLIEKIHSSVA